MELSSLESRVASEFPSRHQHVDIVGPFSSAADFDVVHQFDDLILEQDPVSSHQLPCQSNRLSSHHRHVSFHQARLPRCDFSSLTQLRDSDCESETGLNMGETPGDFLLDELVFEKRLPH